VRIVRATWRFLRPELWALVLGGATALLSRATTGLTVANGLLTPGRLPDLRLLAFAGAFLVLRLLVLFVVPPVVAYRIVRRLLAPGNTMAGSGTPG
jgi:hypothetical protein